MLKLHDKLSAIEADISELACEAIVNAANEPLVMGSGVDGAIRRKAGPDMETDLRRIGCCPTGEAVLTRGYALPARFVVHTVAPIWSGDDATREQDVCLLSNCYRNSLGVARAHGISAIAFPCLGTGVYGWPADLAAQTAFSSVCNFLKEPGELLRVIFCCFSRADVERYKTFMAALA